MITGSPSVLTKVWLSRKGPTTESTASRSCPSPFSIQWTKFAFVLANELSILLALATSYRRRSQWRQRQVSIASGKCISDNNRKSHGSKNGILDQGRECINVTLNSELNLFCFRFSYKPLSQSEIKLIRLRQKSTTPVSLASPLQVGGGKRPLCLLCRVISQIPLQRLEPGLVSNTLTCQDSFSCR